MSDADINHFSVLMEQQNAKLDAVLEYVAEMPKVVDRLGRIEQKVDKLEQDMEVVKAAVTDLSYDLKKHKSLPAHVAHGHA